jgi:DivIVA domain-containing protein
MLTQRYESSNLPPMSSSSPRLPLSSRPAFLPDEVARREFATVFRGYDPAEVRSFLNQLSEQIVETADRVAELQKMLTETQDRVKNPELTEEMVTSLLGEQTAQILRSAREAARDVREKADEEAGQQLRDAHEVSTRMREEAETLLAERTAEAENLAEQIRSEAARDAEGVRRAANEEATALRNQVADETARARAELEQEMLNRREQLERDINLEMSIARAQARDIIDQSRKEANALVARTAERQSELVEGLVRKRKIALAQIEGLRSGRQRLLDAYKLVRSTLDDVTLELGRSDEESRQRADAARERAAAASDLSDEEMKMVIEVEEYALNDDVSPEVIQLSAETEELDDDEDVDSSGDTVPNNIVDMPSAEQPVDVIISDSEFVAEQSGPRPFDFDVDGEPTRQINLVHLAADEDDVRNAQPVAPFNPGNGTTTMVRDVAEADVHPLTVVADEDDDGDREIYSASIIIGDNTASGALKARRDAVVGKARSQATKRLRRALEDEQQTLVSRLRAGDVHSFQALVGSPEDHASAYNRAIVKLLREVVRTGASSVPGSAGVERGVVDRTGTALARDIAAELIDRLRNELTPVIESLLVEVNMPETGELQQILSQPYNRLEGDYLESLVDVRIGSAFDEGVALADSKKN